MKSSKTYINSKCLPSIIIVGIILFASILYFRENLSHYVSTIIYPEIDTNTPAQQNSDVFNLGEYENCVLFKRSGINIPPSDDTLPDKSIVECEQAGEKQTILEILTKKGYETAKNSIYKVWVDSQGYKALIIDQNGAGSGEGIGKVILLKDNNYILQSCFYYTPEELNLSGSVNEPLSDVQLAIIESKALIQTNKSCKNFNINIFIE